MRWRAAVRWRLGGPEAGASSAKVAERGESKRFGSQERSEGAPRLLVSLLNSRGLVSSGSLSARGISHAGNCGFLKILPAFSSPASQSPFIAI